MRLVNNAITGVTYIPTEGHPGTVTRVKRAKPQETAVQAPDATCTQTGKSRQKMPSKKRSNTTQQLVVTTKTKKPRETLNVSCKIVTTAPTKNPVAVRHARKRTLAMKRCRQGKQILQTMDFMPSTEPDYSEKLEKFWNKATKKLTSIKYTLTFILTYPDITADKNTPKDLSEMLNSLLQIYSSINQLPNVSKNAKKKMRAVVYSTIMATRNTRKVLIANRKTR
ncbi:MAG: hypothetical protein J6W40_04560 [Alphaproteobacteria bacterium]|nr:hypothetical protein [Alphaproteobacteria bacterium]